MNGKIDHLKGKKWQLEGPERKTSREVPVKGRRPILLSSARLHHKQDRRSKEEANSVLLARYRQVSRRATAGRGHQAGCRRGGASGKFLCGKRQEKGRGDGRRNGKRDLVSRGKAPTATICPAHGVGPAPNLVEQGKGAMRIGIALGGKGPKPSSCRLERSDRRSSQGRCAVRRGEKSHRSVKAGIRGVAGFAGSGARRLLSKDLSDRGVKKKRGSRRESSRAQAEGTPEPDQAG